MARKPRVISCSEQDRVKVEQMANSRRLEARLVQRAKMVRQCLAGQAITSIADELGVRPNTVIEWRDRFEKLGVQGLRDKPRSGKPRKYDEGFRKRVLETL